MRREGSSSARCRCGKLSQASRLPRSCTHSAASCRRTCIATRICRCWSRAAIRIRSAVSTGSFSPRMRRTRRRASSIATGSAPAERRSSRCHSIPAPEMSTPIAGRSGRRRSAGMRAGRPSVCRGCTCSSWTAAGGLDPLDVDDCLFNLWSGLARMQRQESRTAEWLQRARARLHDDFIRPPRITELAADAGVHPTYFSRAFRDRFGVGPAEYRNRLRVMAACRALAGRDSIQTIAMDLGYADQPHFTRDFTQRIGTSPAAYRRLVEQSRAGQRAEGLRLRSNSAGRSSGRLYVRNFFALPLPDPANRRSIFSQPVTPGGPVSPLTDVWRGNCKDASPDRST